jgi:hypothetical protein
MIIAGIEAIPLRIPLKAGTKSDAFAWGDSNLPAADYPIPAPAKREKHDTGLRNH